MNAHNCKTLFLGLVLAGVAVGQSPGTADKPAPAVKDHAAPREAEVNYGNGSTVYMHILQESIEIQTPFGKLTVLPRDIRQIEFGLHLAPETEARVETALHRLASNNYQQREAAVKELVSLGPQAYLALHRAAKSAAPEAAQRAEQALQQIERKVPAKHLRLNEDDVIRTSKFTIVGKIVTPSIKARAEYFGDLALKPHQLLTIRWLEGASETEVNVDAAKYGSAPNQWLDTGIRVDPQLDLLITATGMVDLWPQTPGQYVAGPSGMAGLRGGVQPVPVPPGGMGIGISATSPGVLVGRIGEAGQVFVIGDRYAGRTAQPGNLYLHIGPSSWNNPSSGGYRVQVVTGSNLVASNH